MTRREIGNLRLRQELREVRRREDDELVKLVFVFLLGQHWSARVRR